MRSSVSGPSSRRQSGYPSAEMSGRKGNAAEVVLVEGREISISNPGKVLFPEARYTKLDLVRYYLAVAEGALRGAGGRPNVLVRYPNGIAGEFFYQKRAPASRPPWVEVVSLRFPSGRSAEEVVPRDAAALAWLANLACLELHPHPVRADDLEHPDELRVDLDPVPGVDVAAGPRGGPRGRSDAAETSGSPAGPRPRARAAARQRAHRTALELRPRCAAPRWRSPGRSSAARRGMATSKWWKEERHGVFVDYNQNAKDRTVASAYSVRPKPDARVSAPIELGGAASCEPGDFTLATMPARYARIGDRHAGIDDIPARSNPCSSCRRGTRARGWATPRGRRTTASSSGSPRGSRRHGARAAKHPLIEIGRARRRRTRSPDSSAGRRATPRRPRISSRRTCWWTPCGAAFPPGPAFG